MKCLCACVLSGLAAIAVGQDAPAGQAPAAPAAPAAPTALPTPAISGPLSGQPPAVFSAGPFKTLQVNGFISGMGLVQNNPVPGDDNKQAALSNGQIVVQKSDGVFQFYLQAGAYNILSVGTPYTDTQTQLSGLYGAVPVGFVKLQAGKNTSFQIGSLPTLVGLETTFSFQNMNIERGLLWNQEPAISRGMQVNQTMGKVTASFSWNDGFYSNRYSWLSGSLTYANGPNTLSFVGAGNTGQTAFTNFATPVQNNGSIYNVIYMFNKGSWMVMPYWQYSKIPTNLKLGILQDTSTQGGAILVSHTFGHGFSLPIRYEYIASSGSAKDLSLNLLYGPGSTGQSFTATPTFQSGGFFLRGDIAWAHAGDFTKGDVFGPLGANNNQFRAVGEIGFVFGNNIMEKKQ